jgi:hypothetical protein
VYWVLVTSQIIDFVVDASEVEDLPWESNVHLNDFLVTGIYILDDECNRWTGRKRSNAIMHNTTYSTDYIV